MKRNILGHLWTLIGFSGYGYGIYKLVDWAPSIVGRGLHFWGIWGIVFIALGLPALFLILAIREKITGEPEKELLGVFVDPSWL